MYILKRRMIDNGLTISEQQHINTVCTLSIIGIFVPALGLIYTGYSLLQFSPEA